MSASASVPVSSTNSASWASGTSWTIRPTVQLRWGSSGFQPAPVPTLIADRGRFDADLLSAGADCGVRVLQPAGIDRLARDGSGWQADVTEPSGRQYGTVISSMRAAELRALGSGEPEWVPALWRYAARGAATRRPACASAPPRRPGAGQRQLQVVDALPSRSRQRTPSGKWRARWATVICAY